MKRSLFTIATLLLLSLCTVAQHSSVSQAGTERPIEKPQKRLLENRADGDTLFHFEGFYYYVNESDSPDFKMESIDLDSLPPHENNYFDDSEWHFLYRVLGPGDTLNWVEATSWFDPAGQADDWITFGPLTVPAGGAQLSWRAYHNPVYRNGYEVKVSADGMNPGDFTGEALFIQNDLFQESSEDIDTNSLFQDPPKQVLIPEQYNDSSIYIAIHHNSEDMDVLHLRDIVVTRKGVGVNEFRRESITNVQSYPNPAREKVSISFFSDEAANVKLKLYDLAGAVIKSRETDIQGGQSHTFTLNVSGLTPGMYFFELNNGRGRVTQKLIVE